MARYLITGGCGFIGSHLADALLDQGHEVRILDNLSSGHRRNAPDAAELIVGDITDRPVVLEALEGMDGVFHLAAVASVERSNEDWVGTHLTNLTGTVTIFDAARTVRPESPVPVVYASSAAVYGRNTAVPLSEKDRPAPMTAYGADKLGCELHAHVAASIHRVRTTGLRFFNVYGPRQDPRSPYSGVISIFCDRLSAGEPLTIYGSGEQVRDFVHVSDVVRFLVRAMTRPGAAGEVFNVCTGIGTSVRQLAAVVAELYGVSREPIFRAARPGDVERSIGDPACAFERFGIKTDMPLREGLKRMLDARSRAVAHTFC